ncbi:MAG: MazG family protein [Chloroflexota bacterium]|nr:MazG family protein [Chloroflexota bacterium]
MATSILIVGLGPGDPLLRTLSAQRALDNARLIILRTRIHPGLSDLSGDPRVIDCDDLYADASSFDALYPAIAARVVAEATALAIGVVVYAVPGHPRFGERSVPLVEAAAISAGLCVEVLPSVSALDVIATTLQIDPLVDEMQSLDALSLTAAIEAEPFGGGLIGIDPRRPVLISQVYSSTVAASVKIALTRLYPDDQPLRVIRSAGIPAEERVIDCQLYELDRQAVNHLTSVWVPALPSLGAFRSHQTLQQIVAYLRGPAGCPWDRAQTHQSLRLAVIEEAYEVVDAVDEDDSQQLAEELGDLLLQVSLHAQIAEESGTFVLEDVYEQISRKLLRRHPHVFGDVTAETPDDVKVTWEAIKAEERAAKPSRAEQLAAHGLPRSMPALQRAASLLGEQRKTTLRHTDPVQMATIGDRILAAVEAAVDCNIDPDRALNAALSRRFPIEAASQRVNPKESTTGV